MNFDLKSRREIAEFLGVSTITVFRWVMQHPERWKSVKIVEGRWKANSTELRKEIDQNTARSL